MVTLTRAPAITLIAILAQPTTVAIVIAVPATKALLIVTPIPPTTYLTVVHIALAAAAAAPVPATSAPVLQAMVTQVQNHPTALVIVIAVPATQNPLTVTRTLLTVSRAPLIVTRFPAIQAKALPIHPLTTKPPLTVAIQAKALPIQAPTTQPPLTVTRAPAITAAIVMAILVLVLAMVIVTTHHLMVTVTVMATLIMQQILSFQPIPAEQDGTPNISSTPLHVSLTSPMQESSIQFLLHVPYLQEV